MSLESDKRALLDDLTPQVIDSYHAESRTHHLDATFLPNRVKIIKAVELLRRIIFPGFFDEIRITRDNLTHHTATLLDQFHELLYEQTRQTLRYTLNRTQGKGKGDDCDSCDQQAADLTAAFMSTIPQLRRTLALDVQAVFDGDPAADSTDEAIFCYPGIDAIFMHRAAHELYKLDVPLIPRIISEYAHNETGIDIHPGATIGESFLIDHGTGVVFGETTHIGRNVKIYQGVSLGALSTKEVEYLRGRKRHPTIEDDVTIYANATILGGETVIGKGATIGGSVFLTRSVPPGHRVMIKQPDLSISPPKPNRKKKGDGDHHVTFDI